MLSNIVQQFMKGVVQIYASLLKIQVIKINMFLASRLSRYHFSTLYTTLPHNLIKDQLTELIEQNFNREGSLYLACNENHAFFTSEQPKRYKLWSCQKFMMLSIIFGTIYL